MNDATFTEKDIGKLAQNMSSKTKTEAIKKVGHFYNDTNLTDNDKKIAEAIFRLMVEDVESQVRVAIAESIKNSENVPKDITQKLISDIDSVSIPFIKKAASLANDDLVAILESQNIARQKAVAGRKGISSELSHYIADKCSEDVLETLLDNEHANIVEKTYNAIVDKYFDNEKIQEKILDRKNLPVSVVERIVSSLSNIIEEKLVANQDVSNNLVSDLVEKIRDKVTLKISQEYNSDKQIKALVGQLYKLNRLTSSLIVRSICMGDLKFFEYSLFYITKKNIAEIRKVLSNTKDEFDIRNIMRDANIPNKLFPAIITALKIVYELNFNLEKEKRENFTQKVIERVLTFDSINEKMDISDIQYLISKIS